MTSQATSLETRKCAGNGEAVSQAATETAPTNAATRADTEETDGGGVPNAKILKAQAAAAVRVSEGRSQEAADRFKPPTYIRVDSSQDYVAVTQADNDRRQRDNSAVPKLLARSDHAVVPAQASSHDTLTTSPNLRKHVLPVSENVAGTLPAFQPTSPLREGTVASPQTDKLPSFRQLSELAEAATQQDSRQQQHAHTQSIGSATSRSPMLPYHPYPGNGQTSPSYHTFSAATRSPSSTIGELTYSSPTQLASSAYFAHRRRSSAAMEHAVPFAPPPLLSASSSSDSHGRNSSGADEYSTSHSTPADATTTSDFNSRTLPPPPGMTSAGVIIPGSFVCDYPGCTAIPFHTQYLLSSHKNVHSSSRPHYCPVKECPRSEGGKGFKRKNEMIRHGLVHNSPGYICPFCPDREHRYPRPDNLQRHVRVHHVDKDRDDPQLREILAQRTEGTGKTRRRRTNASAPMPEVEQPE